MVIRVRDVELPSPLRSRTSPYLNGRQMVMLDARLQATVDAGNAAEFINAMRDALTDPRYSSFARSAGCPLHWVAAAGNPALIADYLRLYGFKDVRVRNAAGMTPLHVVAGVCPPEAPAMASLLLAAGSEVNAKDKEGNTPMHLAVGSPTSVLNRQGLGDTMSLVATLMGEGANPDIKNNAGGRAADLWRFDAAPSLEKPLSMPAMENDDTGFDVPPHPVVSGVAPLPVVLPSPVARRRSP